MNLLITGGDGYIGRSLFASLASKYNVTKITRQNFDMTSYDKTCDWFSERQFDVVIHTAISGGSRLHEDGYSVFENNMAMFNNLVANKHRFSKLITFGSGAELFHGDAAYANSKREIAKRILEHPNFYNLKIFGVFDHNELDTRFIKSNIIRYLKKEPMIIHANMIMDFFYMKDLISLVEYYMINDRLDQETYCSYEDKYTLQNIANLINTLGSHKVPVVIQDKSKLDFYCGNSNMPIVVSGFYAGLVDTFKKLNTE